MNLTSKKWDGFYVVKVIYTKIKLRTKYIKKNQILGT